MINILALTAAVSENPEKWRMNVTLQIVLAAGILLFFIILFVMLKRRRLILKYTLLWMLSAVALAVFLIFPEVLLGASRLIGISNPVNAVFLLFAGFSLLLILSLTSIVSQLTDRNRHLTQALGLLEQRVRDLETAEKNRAGSDKPC